MNLTKSSPPKRLLLTSLSSSIRAIARRRALPERASVLAWGKRFFPHWFEKDFGKHHQWMASRQEKMLLKGERGVHLAITAPRSNAKSTFWTFLYAIYCVCENVEPYIIITADSAGQAVKYLDAIKQELETNAELAKIYPEACAKGRKWDSQMIITASGVCVEVLGSGQAIRGRKHLNLRPTLVIVDDAEGDTAAFSAPERGFINKWFFSSVLKAGSPVTNVIVLGTTIHRECLVCVCQNMPGWESKKFSSILKWPDRMDLWAEWEGLLGDGSRTPDERVAQAQAFYERNKAAMEQGAEVLWEAYENLLFLMTMRATEGHTSFESEKQQNPIDPSKCEWSPEVFQRPGFWFDEWPSNENVIARVTSLDPSKGRTDKPSDLQAIADIRVTSDMDIWVDMDCSRRPVDQMVEVFLQRADENRSDVAVVEDVAFQELIVPMCEDEAVAQSILVPIEGISTEGVPKEIRIRRLGPYLTRGRLHVKRGSKGSRQLVRCLEDFPNCDFYDPADALEMAIRRAAEFLGSDGERVENPL